MFISPVTGMQPQRLNTLTLKPGQIVRGKVLRHLEGGRILTQVQNTSLVAQTSVQVSVGDLLVMYVKKLRPKPQLQVMRRAEQKGGNGIGRRNTGEFLTELLDENMPVSKSLFTILAGTEQPISADTEEWLVTSLKQNPAFWRRLLYHSNLSSLDELISAAEWFNSSTLASSSLFTNQLHGIMSRRIPDQLFSLNLQSVKAMIQADIPLASLSNAISKELGRHLHLWAEVNKMPWENKAWAGTIFPFVLGEQQGQIALSLWSPSGRSAAGQPNRLAIVVSVGNGNLLHGIFEYRTSDFAGVLEANSPSLHGHLEELRTDFHKSLESHGYRNIAFQMNYTPTLSFDYTGLLPEVPANKLYQG